MHAVNRVAGWLIVMLALGVSAWGQRQPVLKKGQAVHLASSLASEGSISVVFVAVTGGPLLSATSAGQGTLQLGEVASGTGAHRPGVVVERHPHSMVVRSTFGIRLDNRGTPQGSASLSAFLIRTDARCDFLVDGIKLAAATRVIQPSVRYGVVTPHRLEVEVPSSVPDSQGDIANDIGFLAVPN